MISTKWREQLKCLKKMHTFCLYSIEILNQVLLFIHIWCCESYLLIGRKAHCDYDSIVHTKRARNDDIKIPVCERYTMQSYLLPLIWNSPRIPDDQNDTMDGISQVKSILPLDFSKERSFLAAFSMFNLRINSITSSRVGGSFIDSTIDLCWKGG